MHTPAADRTVFIPDGALVSDNEGKIVYSGSASDAPQVDATVDFSEHLILPGFVDAHVHGAQARAANVRCGQLLPWLEKVIFPLEASYTPAVARQEAPRFFRSLLFVGTTTAGVWGTVDEKTTDALFAAAKHSGIRAVIGKVMMDRNGPPGMIEKTADSIDASVRLCEAWHGKAAGRLRYAFTPRFALSCSMDLMRGAGQAARGLDAHVMTHLAENREETDRVRELFPEGRSYLDVYERAGLLLPQTVLAHAIHLDEKDWDVLAQSGAGVAHCPVANLLLESGILDLDAPLARNVGVGLGTDIGAGAETAMAGVAQWAVASQAARKVMDRTHRSVDASTALYLMTRGGAQALGLGDRIGDLLPGKEADFLVVDPRPCLPLGQWDDDQNAQSLIWSIVLRFRTEAIKAVYIRGGRVVLEETSP